MKQVIQKLAAGISMAMVFTMHVYFVMLLGTKPALAAEAEQKTEAAVETQAAPEAPKAPEKKSWKMDAGYNAKFKMEDGKIGLKVDTDANKKSRRGPRRVDRSKIAKGDAQRTQGIKKRIEALKKE